MRMFLPIMMLLAIAGCVPPQPAFPDSDLHNVQARAEYKFGNTISGKPPHPDAPLNVPDEPGSEGLFR